MIGLDFFIEQLEIEEELQQLVCCIKSRYSIGMTFLPHFGTLVGSWKLESKNLF